jgi:hypothetical protein
LELIIKSLKQTLIAILILLPFLLSCEKNDDTTIRSSFIIVGDSLNCVYVNYNPDLVFSSNQDSFDINFDTKHDVEFSINSVYIDDCEEYLANCPPDFICDCFATIYADYNIDLSHSIEIAIDNDSTIHEFIVNDTISENNEWSEITKYPLYHREIADPYWTGSNEVIIGLRKIQPPDTLYSWIRLGIENAGFIVKELAIQK